MLYYSRSVANLKLLRFKEAARDLERVLFLAPDFPDFPEACYRLGIARIEFQDYEKALQAFDMLLEQEPAHRESLHYRARVLFNLGRYADAAEAFGNITGICSRRP